MAEFICMEKSGLVITANKVASALDLQAIKKYIKNSYNVDMDNMESPRLLQSKLFFKIIGISYISEITNSYIMSDKIKSIIKTNYIFHNVVLVSKYKVIKVLPKSDISIIWINIWNI